MTICLLSSGHKPNDDRIFYKEARSLAKYYENVWLISPYSQSIPANKDGVKFLSIPTYTKTWVNRFKTMRDLYRAALNLNADVYHCHEPESLLVALKLKNSLRCEVIFDSHEMYSASLSIRFPAYLRDYMIYAYKLYERTKVRRCDYVLGASWAISEYFASFMGSDSVQTILNCPLPEIFGDVPIKNWNEEIIVCHEGHLPFSRGLKTMVKAIEIVKRRHSIKFKIIGDVFGEEKTWLDSYVADHHLENIIERTGWLDYCNVGKALSNCHIGLIALQKLPNNIVTSANKEFNYMYFGIPFIAPDFRLSTNKLIAAERCGLSADSSSPEAYAQAISYLIENRSAAAEMGINARRASLQKYLWTHMEKKLIDVYRMLKIR